MKERKQFTKEFKEGAVRLVTEQGRTIGDAAQSLGISPWTLSRWIKAARTEGADAFRGQGQRPPLEQENFEWYRQLNDPRVLQICTCCIIRRCKQLLLSITAIVSPLRLSATQCGSTSASL